MEMCPEPGTLAAFAAGKLCGASLERVACHVDECLKCQSRVNSEPFDTDPFLAGLRQPDGQASFLQEQGCVAALARFRKVQEPAAEETRVNDSDAIYPTAGMETVAGRYHLGEEIARGGMGYIVRVRDDDFDRSLAMKVLLKRGGDFEERFLREARLTGLLQHPGIPAVHALGRLQDGRPYFVMKLIQGLSLQALLKERSTPTADLLRFVSIFAQICQTVGYAHARGVIHRDLKPSNVMVGAFGEVQVIDWGLAKYLATREHEADLDQNQTAFRLRQSAGLAETTLAGSVLGTPAYMAPEQARGEVDGLEANADVFGLGAILCEILTGRPPFVGPHTLEQARQGNLLEPLNRLAGCGADAGLVDLARRCLAPRREDRPVNGAAVADAVAAYQAELARRLQQAEIDRAAEHARAAEERKLQEAERARTNAERRRRRTVRVLAATLLIFLLVMLAGYLVDDLVRRERDLAIESQKLAEKAEQRARQAEKENKILSHLGQAMALRQSHKPGRRARALEEIRAAVALEPSPDLRRQLRNETIACLSISLDFSPGKKWNGYPIGSDHFDFDGKLERFACADRQGNVSIRRVADNAVIGKLPEAKGAAQGETWPRLSPDGRFLSTLTGGWIQVWNIEENPPVLLLRKLVDSAAFHADKPILAAGLKNGTVEVFDLREGKTRHSIKVGGKASVVAWHPRANRLAVAHPKGVKVYDLDTGQWTANLDLKVIPRDHLAWHPEGRVLAIACGDMRVRLWHVEKNRVQVLEKVIGLGVAMAFNHRGDLLATTAWGEVLRLWDPRTGKHLEQLPWGNAEIPRFGPDDRLLAARTRDNSLQFWEIASATEYRTLARVPAFEGGDCHNGVIGLEGRLLAVGMNDAVALWDLKTAAFLTVVPSGLTWSLAFDHASEALYTNGPRGVLRWPVQAEAKSGRVRIGPPQELHLSGNSFQIAVSTTGTLVAQAVGKDGGVALRQKPERLFALSPHRDARYIAISPDDRWIATGSHNGEGARIWDGQTGKLIHELSPRAPSWGVEFSGDGQWLATEFPSCQLWKVGTWEQTHQFPGTQHRFAPDGKVLAVESGRGVVRLFDPANGQELARLENPYQVSASRIIFSPDGSQLVTLGGESYPLHVWDLRKIRRQLVELGLDWDMSHFPPESAIWSNGPLQIQVDSDQR